MDTMGQEFVGKALISCTSATALPAHFFFFFVSRLGAACDLALTNVYSTRLEQRYFSSWCPTESKVAADRTNRSLLAAPCALP